MKEPQERRARPWTTLFQQLLEEGVDLPAPQTLDEQDASEILEQVCEALGRRSVRLRNTDHLSRLELYSVLWHETLRRRIGGEKTEESVWAVELLDERLGKV